jgi:Fe-S-cluster containining protein
MEHTGPTHFEFSESSLVVTMPGSTPLQKKLAYVHYPHIRDLARKMVNIIVTEHAKELFLYLCSRCGNCCCGRDIVILQHEIKRLSQYLEMQDLEVREEFIEPAATWNLQDGILKKLNGACVFLQQGSSGMTACSIYEVRPSFCDILSPPSMDICKKDPGMVIDELEKITIYQGTMTIGTRGGTCVKTLLRLPLLRSMIDHIERLAGQAGKSSLEKQEILLQHSDPIAMTLDEPGGELHECTNTAPAQQVPDAGRKPLPAEEENPVCRETMESPKPAERQILLEPSMAHGKPAARIRGIRLMPDHLEIMTGPEHGKDHCTLYYRENPAILKKIRSFHEAFTRNPGDRLVNELFKGNRHCHRCGECCTTLRIEISLRDIRQLADHLGITVPQMRQRFLQPALHSWDEQSGCLNRKVESPGEKKGCVFLGFQGALARCTVYNARPEICRIYIPDREMCLRRNRDKVKELPGPARVDIIDGTVHLLTRYREKEGLPPYVFSLCEEPVLMALYRSLERDLKNTVFGA